MGNEITAVDASPEMLEIARQKLGEKRINYQQADLFHWEPDRQYDLVFSANWLSHVPPTRLDKFLNAVQQSVRAGGQLAIIDQYQPSNSDKLVAKESIYATRPIEDGRQFTIVKAFHDLKFLQAKFEAFSFEVSINRFNDTFFFLTGTAKSAAQSPIMINQNEIILETERLMLRRLTMNDLDDLFALYHSPEVRKYYSEGIPSYAETKQELAWMIDHCYAKYGFGMWATLYKSTGKFIGRCGLTPMDIEGHEEIEVGYMLSKEYWGQGLATEAALAILRYGFEQAGSLALDLCDQSGERGFQQCGVEDRYEA